MNFLRSVPLRLSLIHIFISQTPEQGEKKKANATVDLIVSLGQEMTTVPDLTGMTVRQAKFELEKAELVLGTTERDFHEEIPVDSIMPVSYTHLSRT